MRVTPKESGSLIGGAELSWDAVHGVPLRAAIYSSTSSSPAIELAATEISYGPVEASVFEFTPPANAKIEEIVLPDKHTAKLPDPSTQDGEHPQVTTHGHGLSTIAVIESQDEDERRKQSSSLPEGLQKVKINGIEADRAAHRARHAAQLRALRRALPARRRGQPSGGRSGRQGPVA